ncbi:MAG: hypothetical protein OXC66_06235, partial [Roseovarius sp.]|nr:hypothetical protein [Roseovarius sp.]
FTTMVLQGINQSFKIHLLSPCPPQSDSSPEGGWRPAEDRRRPPTPHRPLRHPGPNDRLHRTAARAGPGDDARPPGALPEAPRVARDPFEAPALPVRQPGFPFCRFPARSRRRREDNVTLPEKMKSHVSN